MNSNIGNGISTVRTLYSEKRKKGLKNIIKVARKQILKKYGVLDHNLNILAGTRFDDDEEIIMRIESSNQDEVRSVGWMESVRCALINAMMSDYWYKYEKEW